MYRDGSVGILRKPDEALQNFTNSNIPRSPGVDLGPEKNYEPGSNEETPQYRALVGSFMWLSFISRPDIANALRRLWAL